MRNKVKKRSLKADIRFKKRIYLNRSKRFLLCIHLPFYYFCRSVVIAFIRFRIIIQRQTWIEKHFRNDLG